MSNRDKLIKEYKRVRELNEKYKPKIKLKVDIENVLVNPTETEIDRDLEKSEQIVVLHYNKSGNFDEWVKDWIYKYQSLGFDIVYIHYYTGDKSITLGLKARD